MKKRFIAFVTDLATAFTLAFSASADDSEMRNFIYDELGNFSVSQMNELHGKLKALSDGYGFGVGIAFVEDFDGLSPDDYAQRLFFDMNIGYGAGENGVLLVVCPSYNGWECHREGIGVPMFTGSVTSELDQIAEKYISSGDYYAMTYSFGQLAEDTLTDNGRAPVKTETRSDGKEGFVTWFVTNFPFFFFCAIIGIFAGVTIMLFPLNKMKSVAMQKGAHSYVVPNSFRLCEQSEVFLGNDREAAYQVLGKPKPDPEMQEQYRQIMAAVDAAKAKAKSNSSNPIQAMDAVADFITEANKINNQNNNQ